MLYTAQEPANTNLQVREDTVKQIKTPHLILLRARCRQRSFGEDMNRGVYVERLSEVSARPRPCNDCPVMLRQGSTHMNERSSRSHAVGHLTHVGFPSLKGQRLQVFTLYVEAGHPVCFGPWHVFCFMPHCFMLPLASTAAVGLQSSCFMIRNISSSGC